jgi:hypothetical protein
LYAVDYSGGMFVADINDSLGAYKIWRITLLRADALRALLSREQRQVSGRWARMPAFSTALTLRIYASRTSTSK